MEKREVGRKSTRTVPVIIENHENSTKKTKLMVPSNYTAGQLVNILRSRMHLRPSHPVYLFLKSKQSPVLMSKSIGLLHHKHRDEKGFLRFIHTGQTSFGFRGNIRAIRFRQKWIENLVNSSGYSGGFSFPPPYFPLELPSTENIGEPLDVDNLNDLIDEIPSNEDTYADNMENIYTELDDSVYVSDVSSWQSDGSSQSSALTEWADPLLSSSLAGPYLSDSDPLIANPGNPSWPFIQDIDHVLNLDVDMTVHIHNASETGLSSVLAIPNTPSTNLLNPQVNLNNLLLYDPDSELYESDYMEE